MIFFTADCHFGHANIIKFCNRPYRNIEHMNNRLIANFNEMVRKHDTIYHVGDFALKTGSEGLGIDPIAYEAMINGKMVHILGNHDRNNHLRNSIDYAEISFGGNRWALQHIPPTEDTADPSLNYICGHVHKEWKIKRIGKSIVVNVGVDVWDYRPVKLHKLIRAVSLFERKEQDES